MKKFFSWIVCITLVLTMTLSLCACSNKCDHNFGEWQNTKAPTCTSIGYKTRSCSECDYVEYDFVDQTGHTFGEWQTDHQSSCTSVGIKTKKCSVCNMTEYQTMAQGSHNYQTTKVTNEYIHKTCTICGDTSTEFFANPVDFSNTTIAFLGDSITYGYVTKQGGQYENPYPKLVGQILGAKESINYGRGSSTLASGENSYKPFVDRYLQMDENIDIIGVMGGVNDFSRNIPLGSIDDTDTTTIYGALNVLADGLKQKYPDAYIFFMSPLPMTTTSANSQGYKMSDVRQAVYDVALKHKLDFLDMYLLSGFENEMRLDTTDGVHPSQELVENSIAPQIAQFIIENYTPPVDFSKLAYCAFGDSITEGAGLENKGYSYPSQVGNILGCQVTNKGVSGSSLAYDSSRHCIAYDVMQNTKLGGKYDIISVTGGSNDKALALPLGTINDNTYNTIYGSLNVIADSLTKTYPNAFIFFMTPIKNPTCDVINSENYNLLDICNAIKQVASKFNFPVLDLYNTSQYEDVDCGMNSEGSDGWHPHKEFISQYMAPQIAQFIKDNYTPPVDFSQLTYSALGDSITAADNKIAYPTRVKEILGLKNAFNKGIGATTISNVHNGMVDRYTSISIYSDIISIQGGINDCRLGANLGTIDSFDKSTFMGAYNSLIKGIKEKYSNSYVFLMSMPKTYNSTTLDFYVNGNIHGYNYLDYNNAIYEIADKWNLPVLDLYFDSFWEDTKNTDGVHPSQEYIDNTLAPLIAQFIKDNYTK